MIRRALFAIVAVAALVIAAMGGYLLAPTGTTAGRVVVAEDSVDAGFARDMATHHTQAVSMATYTRDNGSDPAITLLAYDIESSQQFQLGQLDGWLASWRLSRTSSLQPMAWMGSSMSGMSMGGTGALMPGLATAQEMAKLTSLAGSALDIYFLQLMLRHHQGGLPMAQYAATHAGQDYVRSLASTMAAAQSGEIVTMEQLLRERGAVALPAPS